MSETRTPKQIAADKLDELIEKLEKAEGPNYRLEIDIFKLFNPEYAEYVEGRGGLVHVNDGEDQRVLSNVRAPNYTASLDAAVALAERVLPGWSIFTCLGQTVWPDKPPCWADVGSREFQEDIDGHDQENSTGFAPTLPLALCLAILKAVRAHMHPRDREESGQ